VHIFATVIFDSQNGNIFGRHTNVTQNPKWPGKNNPYRWIALELGMLETLGFFFLVPIVSEI